MAERVLRFTTYQVIAEATNDDVGAATDDDEPFFGLFSSVDEEVGRDESWGPEFYTDAWWGDEWPKQGIVETWSRYEREWILWERAQAVQWDYAGLYDEDVPAKWEPGARAWVEGFRPEWCVHCGLNRSAYADGTCRTCYRWLMRNRNRYPKEVLRAELGKRVAARRAQAVTGRETTV